MTIRNCVQLIGNLGNEPVLRTLENGTSVMNLSLATHEYYYNNDGKREKSTQWHQLVAWGKQADRLNKVISKGCKLAVTGKIQYKFYTDKYGVEKMQPQIRISQFDLFQNTKAEA